VFWERAYALINLCVPEQKREVAQDLVAEMDSKAWQHLWEGTGRRIFSITVTFILGFCVHVLTAN
jgi:hypothetical protein